MASKKVLKKDSEIKKEMVDPSDLAQCGFCPSKVSAYRISDHWFNKHKNACFACAMCPSRLVYHLKAQKINLCLLANNGISLAMF